MHNIIITWIHFLISYIMYNNILLLQSRVGGWFTLTLSFSGGSSPPHPPARFDMPAARGKTSLNARDW